MKRILLCLVALFSVYFSVAQEKSAWKVVERKDFGIGSDIRRSTLPRDYKLFQFDYQKFVTALTNVPKRGEFFGQSSVIVSIPNPEGKLVDYRIIEASNFEDSLQDQFPKIRSFAGNAVNNAGSVVRFSISPYNGLSAIIRNTDGSTYIVDPFSIDYKTVIIYDRQYSGKANGSFSCTTTDEAVKEFGRNIEGDDYSVQRNADDGSLRVFRMAQSCTGEYANYFGASTAGTAADEALVLAAYNATYTRVNALFEMDFNATMQLIANTTDVIFYDPTTDPYSDAATGTGGAWNGELGAELQATIGNANYDIGHLFGATGGGGNAGCIGCVCSANNSKGQGYTSPADGIPEGDNFDVDYVAHEIGHQLGGNHTFSMGTENNSVNMEPGSGVTIMGYAGITGATDVADHSIPIFHAGSINQITTNIKSKSCPTIIATGNSVPVVTVPSATKTLPRGTAFKLTGSATDADSGDVLSYCWEQVNDATTVGAAASYPSETKTNGANFRSFMPQNHGTRYFPRMEDHVANGITGNIWEIVSNKPTGANVTQNFRLTVRDNRAGGGNNESANVAVTFDRTKGPFLITSQNTAGISYTQGSTQTVTWSVNSTNTMTGAANVNIKLSTNGGQTFDTMLLANTPNDGSQTVTIPNVSAPYCRILIEPTGNDFYAINTNDFAIGYTVTNNTVCNTYSNNTALPIDDGLGSNISGGDVSKSIVTTGISGVVSDINVHVTSGHTYFWDLNVTLTHEEEASTSSLLARNCNNSSPSGFNITFDDAGGVLVCTDPVSGTYLPSSSLSIFNDKNPNATWTITANDNWNGDTGNIDIFEIEICATETTITETPNACGVITTTWNGSSWSNGVPLKNVQAIFDGNYSSSSDLEACSIIINTGANVILNSGNTLVVTNEVTVNGTGSLVIDNNAALRQINGDAVNTGNIVLNRDSETMIRLDYTAWSSPVNGQQLQAFSPNTVSTRFYEYLYTGTTTPTAYQSVNATNNFDAGKGYMIRVDNTWSSVTPSAYSGQFIGVPFNGDFTQSLGKGYNLLGNPYASPIDADRFLFDNSTYAGALYFWTNTTPASGGVYPQNNFASYTTLGGSAAFASGKIPGGYIMPGQGFFVRSFDFGSALFTNDQRVNASTSTQFFRAANTAEVEKHRIWLNLNDDNTSYNQILVGYMEGATSGVDNMIDGKTLDTSKPMLYSVLNDEAYVIQGKGLPFSDEDIIPLGLKVLETGSYSINIEQVDGLFNEQDIFLKDKVMNITHDLKQGDYQFTTQAGEFTDRFELVFKAGALSQEEVVSNQFISVYTTQTGIQVNSSENIEAIAVFDVLGRKLFESNQIRETQFTITSLLANKQALIVKVKDVNGNTQTQKVIF